LAQNPIYAIWGRNALTDPVLLAAILFHSAVHLDLRNRRLYSTVTLHQKGEFIRLLNERLKASKDATSDSTIGAVGFVAATGVRLLQIVTT
jgi:hypothetical protein